MAFQHVISFPNLYLVLETYFIIFSIAFVRIKGTIHLLHVVIFNHDQQIKKCYTTVKKCHLKV